MYDVKDILEKVSDDGDDIFEKVSDDDKDILAEYVLYKLDSQDQNLDQIQTRFLRSFRR